ncbi:MAG: endonuclease/exonuclease/phosphatase family protein [Flavobacteriales bacterium]
MPRFSLPGFALLLLGLHSLPSSAQHPDEVAVVTFNIRYDNPGDPVSWAERRETVIGSVSWYDLLGFQEVLSHQMDDLVAGLPRHDSYGVGRDDGGRAGEACPIFWNRDRFERIHAETLWLSPTPQEVGSIGWDAELPRIATVVVLHDRQTGKVFRLINAHFSHIGEVAREASARMLSMRMAGSTADVNLLMGDLNAEPGSLALEVLTAGRLADAHDAARKRCRQKIGTYTGFATTGLRGAPRIDHLLVDGGDVLWYCTEERILDGFYMSDHLPVYIALMP